MRCCHDDDAPKRQRTAPPAPAPAPEEEEEDKVRMSPAVNPFLAFSAPAPAVLPAVAAPIAIDLPAAEEELVEEEELALSAHVAAEEEAAARDGDDDATPAAAGGGYAAFGEAAELLECAVGGSLLDNRGGLRTAGAAPAFLPAVAAPIAIDLPAAEEELVEEEAAARDGDDDATPALSARAQIRALLAAGPPCPPRLVAGHGLLIASGQAAGAARVVWAAGGAAGRAETAVLRKQQLAEAASWRKQQLAEAGSLREQLAEAGSSIGNLSAVVRGLAAAGQRLRDALLAYNDDDADAEHCECCGAEV
jgi:hypothetical protein